MGYWRVMDALGTDVVIEAGSRAEAVEKYCERFIGALRVDRCSADDYLNQAR